MAIPAAAAAAYRSVAQLGAQTGAGGAASGVTPANVPGGKYTRSRV